MARFTIRGTSLDTTEFLSGHGFGLHLKPSINRREVSDGRGLCTDGNLGGIDLDQASQKLEIKEIIRSKLLAKVKLVA